MRYIYRLLFLISASLFIITACGIDTNKNARMNNATSFLSESQVREAEETGNTAVSEPKVKAAEVKANANETDDAEETTETVEAKEKVTDQTTPPEDMESAESNHAESSILDQPAIRTLADKTGLNIQEYSYILTHEANYVEIEVREASKHAQTHAALQGIFRYYPLTQEIFIRDYLTGDYFLYEDYIEMQNR